jgi:hypothetical protein
LLLGVNNWEAQKQIPFLFMSYLASAYQVSQELKEKNYLRLFENSFTKVGNSFFKISYVFYTI